MKKFVNKKDKEEYLQLCENLFALAEDFNRNGHTTETLILKNVFVKITKSLNKKQQKELHENMDSRGL